MTGKGGVKRRIIGTVTAIKGAALRPALSAPLMQEPPTAGHQNRKGEVDKRKNKRAG